VVKLLEPLVRHDGVKIIQYCKNAKNNNLTYKFNDDEMMIAAEYIVA
jgi:hypothetical protein